MPDTFIFQSAGRQCGTAGILTLHKKPNVKHDNPHLYKAYAVDIYELLTIIREAG